MESNNYEWFITQTVEAMMPRFTHRNVVLAMKIDARWTDHGYDKEDGNTQVRNSSAFGKEIFLVFHRPTNYTKVLMFEIAKKKHVHIPCEGEITMKQLSDHDSCWQGAGMSWVFQAFVDAWQFFEDEVGIEGRDIDPMFHYSIFNGEPQYWLINSMKGTDPDNRWNDDYIVDFDRKLDMSEISDYMPHYNEKSCMTYGIENKSKSL